MTCLVTSDVSLLPPGRRLLLPDADATADNEGFDIPDGQTLLSRLQWEDSPDVSPTDSASSKAGEREEQCALPHPTANQVNAFPVFPRQAPTTWIPGGRRRRREWRSVWAPVQGAVELRWWVEL